ncbi:MAG: M28 family peptidase [Bacteroidales bacterium]|nr:M28 family peptidase [Bacteroidales bacterium]
MRKLLFTLLLVISFNLVNAQNQAIQEMMDEVSGDSIWNYISELVELDRYSITDNMEAPEYLEAYFKNLGFDTVYFHEYNEDWIPNVIAEKKGMLYPDSVYILGAHYDVYTAGAPGADDNGSGTAGVMEVARIISDTTFDKTIRLICFSGEELGLIGSEEYTYELPALNQTVVSMINMDMISHTETGEEDPKIWIASNSLSSEVFEDFKNTLVEYVPEASWGDGSTSWYSSSSDHASFWSQNIPAIFINDCLDTFSPDFNHFIHTDNDVIGTSSNNKELAVACVKAASAMLVQYAGLYVDPNLFMDKYKMYSATVYPNPANDLVNFQIDGNIESYKVVNLTGQVIVAAGRQDTDLIQIDCSNWTSGIYTVLIQSESGLMYNSKFIKR